MLFTSLFVQWIFQYSDKYLTRLTIISSLVYDLMNFPFPIDFSSFFPPIITYTMLYLFILIVVIHHYDEN